jgi:hypothetical protein
MPKEEEMRAAAAAGMGLALVLALPASGALPRRASLELRSTDPVVVLGRGFGPREPVLVTASARNVRRIVPLIARRDGTFSARFDLRLGRCTPLTVRAVGTRGSRAILQAEPGCRTPVKDRDQETPSAGRGVAHGTPLRRGAR